MRPNGERVVYDVNTNTNYNAEAEQIAAQSGIMQSPITLAVCYPMFIGNSPNANSIRWSAARAQRGRSGLHLHRLTCFLFRVSRPLPFVVGADKMGAR